MSRPIGRGNIYHGRGVGGYGPPPSDYGRGGSYYQQPSDYGRSGSYYQQPSGYTGGVSFNQQPSGYGVGGYFKSPMNQSYQSPMMNYNRPGEQPSNDNMNYSIPHEHQITAQNFSINMQCDMCLKFGKNENESFCYFCAICKFNICPECYGKIIQLFTQIVHPHQLYISDGKNKTCEICNSNKRKLFIKCNEGDFNCCINCFRERSDVKIEPNCSAQ